MWGRGVATTFLMATTVSSASAAPDKKQCVAAYDQSQRLRHDGKLRDAHATLRVCASAGCPSVVQSECTQWLAEVEAATPSIVIEARDRQGRSVAGARVWLDGAAAELTGRAVDVDPGEHVVQAAAPDGTTAEQRVVVIEGQKLQRVSVVVGRPEAPVMLRRVRSKPSAAFWVMGGLGLAAFAAMAALDISGKVDESDMLSTCAPSCDPGRVSDMRTRVLLGDVSMGVGIAAVLTAGILFFTRGWVMVAPTRTGASAVATFRF